jgi:hypothetical protein
VLRVAQLAVVALGAAVFAGPGGRAAAAPPTDTRDELRPPELLDEVAFQYPAELRGLALPPAGTVVVRYVVGIDGIPRDLEIVESVHPVLDAAAREAVARLRYRPGEYRGRPVEVVLSLGLEIAARPPRAPPAETGPLEPPDVPPTIAPVQIEGRVLQAGERTPVPGVVVLAVPAGELPPGRVRRGAAAPDAHEVLVRATADEAGRFTIAGVPDGNVRLILIGQGLARLDVVVRIEPGEALELTLYATRIGGNPYKTTVDSERDTAPEVSRRSISSAEINAIPGTQGDALKAVQNFPGVARAPFGAGLLVIRGAAPGDSAVYLGYHEIPTLFHFGGITSVFNSDILTQIDFIPGNFDSRYGDAIGGIVNVVPRAGRRDGYHGYADVDVFDTTLMVEGPVGKGSFALSGRRSYVDAILRAALPDDLGLRPTLAPRYYDYQALFDHPLAGGELSVRGFGSDDRVKLLFADGDEVETDARDRLETIQWFHRADLVYRREQGPWDLLITPSYKHEFLRLFFADALELGVAADVMSVRAEVGRALSRRAHLRIGTETVNTWFTLDARATAGPDDQQVRRTTDGLVAAPAVYSTLTLGVTDALTLYPGVRVTYYSSSTADAARIDRATIDPRLRGALRIADRTTLKAGVGLYSQAATPAETDVVFGNPALAAERSLHTSLGVAQELPRDANVEATFFYKNLWDVITPSERILLRPDGSAAPERLANHGRGRIYGLELLARKDLRENLFGWLSYTLMRSEVRPAPGEPWQLFDFDQTHILTVIASYRLPWGWQVGARYRLVSGNPTTRVSDGVLDASSGEEIPLYGKVNGGRLPPFHQLDFRIDKTWSLRLVRVTFYVDIQNAYNAENPEFVNYAYDYSEKTYITSLPTTPSLGTRIQF